MSDQALYDILTEDTPKEIPWEKAASQFIKLKMASGGLLPEEIEEVHELVKTAKADEGAEGKVDPSRFKKAAAVRATNEEIQKAQKAGLLSGARSAVSQDIARSEMIRRKRGERVGKNIGSVAGAAGGAALGRKFVGGPAGTIGGAALGTVLGYGTGKFLGEESDRAKIKKRFKAAAIEKQTGQEKTSNFEKDARSRVISMMMAKKAELAKRAQDEPPSTPEDEGIPVEAPVEPAMDPAQDPTALDAFLEAQQQANEAEFFKQKAEESQMLAQQATEQADMAQATAEQAQQQADMQAQDSAMREEASSQQTAMAQQQAQMASQDAVTARNESLMAQQQNIQMRQAVTDFRQSLMNLIAQDPTQMVPPPIAPTGQMPGMEEAAAGPPPEAGPPGPPEGAPPEGMPPGPPGAGGGPPPEGGMPPGAPPQGPLPGPPAPGAPPGAPPPEAQAGPPQG